jgi:GntR family transcriptional regulator/MocR family aminotransferase
MARWELVLTLERQSGVPLVQQIARAIASDIRRGRLSAGDALPGTRTLARTLGVQRQTVVSAIDDLVAEGWLVARAASGTFVSTDLPDPKPRRLTPKGASRGGMAARAAYDLNAAPEPDLPFDVPRGGLLFAPSRPDVRLAPGDLIGRAYRRAIGKVGGALLSYAAPEGHPRLRQALATMLASTRGLPVTAANVCVTRGSQMAISLLARALVRPGDVVLVEELGYRPAWEAFRAVGAKVIGVPIDDGGLRMDVLERAISEHRVRAVYVTPHHQFPTTVTLSGGRRLRLLDLARAHRFAIVEDDFDHEFHYDGRPVLPLASSDPHGVVAYVGTLSKVLAPGLRIGYVAGPATLIAQIAAHRSYVDTQGDQVLEYAIAELLEDGTIQRHVRRMRREYGARRDVLVGALREHLHDHVTFSVPAGGIALWVEAKHGVDVDAWARAARGRGALVVTAANYTLDGGPLPFFRLGFASLNADELREGVRRLAIAARDGVPSMGIVSQSIEH